MSKTKRVGFKLDMTPMVDVGFLLLTFFMLTTQFKPSDVAEVVLPSSHSVFKLPDSDVMTVTVDKEGNVYLGFDAQPIREAIFGVQNKLKAGVQVQLTELGPLLREARIRNPKLRTVIKADSESEYAVIQGVMETLQRENITRFNLVTDLEK
ncbi:MAG: biopolymer transporter ExbD [Ignavibacteriales bacterium]|nr:biopolymer transporter ExbD [Ignavibacteriales bacterium]